MQNKELEQDLIINSRQEMAGFARNLAKNAKKGDIFCLNGTLGSGKTFFAQEFINFLSKDKQEIQSPTFNIVYSYESEKSEISHFDLYRLKSEQELENIGFFDLIKESICLIEWPDLAKKYLFKYKDIYIKIPFIENEEARKVKIIEIDQ